MTTYNRRQDAAAAIDSVLAQSHQQIHLVIVDDASSDGTAELAQAYAAMHPETVTAITKTQNRGVAHSIRLGLEAPPDAPFVAFLDHDDQWYPSKLERQLEFLKRDPSIGLVYSEAEVFDDELQPTGKLFSDLFGRFTSGDFDEVLRENHANASTLLLTGELAGIAARSMPERSLVWDYYLILIAAGYSSIAMLDEPLALYRNSESGLHTQYERMRRDMTLAREELFSRHPQLVDRIGGPRAVRRRLALRELEVAIQQLRRRNWRGYTWHARALIRQRSVRPLIWLPIHTISMGKITGTEAGRVSVFSD